MTSYIKQKHDRVLSIFSTTVTLEKIENSVLKMSADIYVQCSSFLKCSAVPECKGPLSFSLPGVVALPLSVCDSTLAAS